MIKSAARSWYFTLLKTVILLNLLTGAFRWLQLAIMNNGSYSNTGAEAWQVLSIGLRYDFVIAGYLMALPILLMIVAQEWESSRNVLKKTVRIYLSVCIPLLLFGVIADIPYFKFFHNRLTESAFQWMSQFSMVADMILSDTLNIVFLLVAFFTCSLAAWYTYKKANIDAIEFGTGNNWKNRLLYVPALFICFMAMRGRTDHPIRQGDAFFCNNPVLNQLGLNPIFTLIKSYTDKVNLMDNQEAILNTRRYLNIDKVLPGHTPLYRRVQYADTARKYNIVLVLMESMSGNFMQRFGNPQRLTPNLDSLSRIACFFENAYSAGIHTNNGVFSSLYSFPAIKGIRPMSMVPARSYTGLPYALKQQGYKNIFFTSHDEGFDNLGTFIPANHFEKLYSAKDYDPEKLIGTFGLPDADLFAFATARFDQEQQQPFFATILTTSNHEPYCIPESYSNAFQEQPNLRAVNYADECIGNFLKEARQHSWFNNTVFVFVADHGLVVGNNSYDLALSYHHIPLIVYSPALFNKPQTYSELIGQIDIFPTLMGMLHLSYDNNTLGKDVLKQPREAIYFSADDKIGCLNANHLFVYRFGGNSSLYQWSLNNLEDYASAQPDTLRVLKDYCFSQIQSAEYFFVNDLCGPRKP